ncbi:hypothetical protein, partial [Mycolicibacterium smegmatis]
PEGGGGGGGALQIPYDMTWTLYLAPGTGSTSTPYQAFEAVIARDFHLEEVSMRYLTDTNRTATLRRNDSSLSGETLSLTGNGSFQTVYRNMNLDLEHGESFGAGLSSTANVRWVVITLRGYTTIDL